jgi:hypothetical protein
MFTVATIVGSRQYPVNSDFESDFGEAFEQKHLSKIANVADILSLHAAFSVSGQGS